MKYHAVIAMLPRLLRAEEAADYVGGETMLKELAVEPFSRRKGSTLYDRVDLDRAIEITNASAFGNGAAIFTNSGKAAREFKHRVKAGMVGINVGVPATMAMFPFTGWDDSFYGDLHIQGREAVQFYTQQKVVTTRWFGDGVGDVWKK